MVATFHGYVDTVTVLLENGANPDAMSNCSVSACKEGAPEKDSQQFEEAEPPPEGDPPAEDIPPVPNPINLEQGNQNGAQDDSTSR